MKSVSIGTLFVFCFLKAYVETPRLRSVRDGKSACETGSIEPPPVRSIHA